MLKWGCVVNMFMMPKVLCLSSPIEYGFQARTGAERSLRDEPLAHKDVALSARHGLRNSISHLVCLDPENSNFEAQSLKG